MPSSSDLGFATGDFETSLLESTIEKITGLLRVGFGEAGAGIISANLKFDEETSKNGPSTRRGRFARGAHSQAFAIDPLLPGVRIYAIFGFCDIHHFEDSK